MRHLHLKTFTFLVLVTELSAAAGAVPCPDYVRTGVERGRVMPTTPFVRGDPPAQGKIDWYQSGLLEMGWQTTGDEAWQQAYHFPSYGIGFQGAGYHDQGQIGQPISAYAFFIYPLERWGNWTLNSNWKFGMAGHWNRYDPANNPHNIAISAPLAVMLDFGGTFDYALTRKLDLGFGVSYTHFSNGGSQQPNQGLNSFSPLVQVTYHIEERPLLPEPHVPFYQPNWEIDLQGWGGWTNLASPTLDAATATYFPTHNFTVAGVTALLNRQTSWKSKWGAGLDAEYDDSRTQTVAADGLVTDSDSRFWAKSDLGVLAGYEQVVSKLSVVVQLGYYVWRTSISGQLPDFYQKVGLKYHFYKDYFFGMNVRIHDFQKTQHLEWTIGHRWVL